jgi:integrase
MAATDMAKLRLRYVKAYSDRTGKARHYFRKPGRRTVPLPGLPGSLEFMEAYQAALGTPPPVSASRDHKPGSVAALVTDYLKSADFSNLKPNSQRVYRIAIDAFSTLHGHRMVHDMPRAAVAKYIHSIGAEKPAMANVTRDVLRKLLAYAVANDYRPDNPVTQIQRYKGGTHHTWTDGELAAYERRWPLGTRERLAYSLLLQTGQRAGDIVRMRRADITGGSIALVQQKTGVELSIPISAELDAALRAGPTNGLHLIGAANGRPINQPALSFLIKRAAAAAGLPPKCVAHGLRKAQLRRLAEHGATVKEIASVSGHKSLKEVERYTAAADQKRLSSRAIARLKSER